MTGWDQYTGLDPDAIAAGQFDFLTLATHELAHTVGLGESSDPISVMYEYLSAGTVRRTFTDGNLAQINTNADRFMKVKPHGGVAREGLGVASCTEFTAGTPAPSPSNAPHGLGNRLPPDRLPTPVARAALALAENGFALTGAQPVAAASTVGLQAGNEGMGTAAQVDRIQQADGAYEVPSSGLGNDLAHRVPGGDILVGSFGRDTSAGQGTDLTIQVADLGTATLARQQALAEESLGVSEA